jgi:HNH endonuclease
MTISVKTQKMLWGRAAGRCSNPDCRLDLYEDETETDDPTLVGENCHIVAESDDGPRADPSMPLERRNSYTNLILLCRNHHKVIDAQEGQYTVARLHEMKRAHESWVAAQLGFDAARQRDDEAYAGMIETWERLAHVDEWLDWSSFVLGGGQPSMRVEIDSDLRELRSWLLNRVWPGRYPELERTFENFRRVLEDFHETFRENAKLVGNSTILQTQKFYKISEWDPERYARLGRQYEFHVDLVQDLMLELSRAANLIGDRIRQYVMHSYRHVAGRLVVQSGPTMEGAFHDFVVEYSADERKKDYPYPGLKAFLTERQKRDRHFGKGTAA